MASKLSLRDKINLFRPPCPPSTIVATKRSKLADTLKKLQDCGTFSLAVDSEEFDIRIDECERYDDSAPTATATAAIIESDAKLRNTEDGSDSDDNCTSKQEDSEQFAGAPEPSELVLCCSEITASHCTDGASKSKNSENFLAQRALHSVDLTKLVRTRCYANCKRECIDRVGLIAIAKLRYFVWFERTGMKRSQADRLEAIYALVIQGGSIGSHCCCSWRRQ
jgi:hypothetical protein